MARRGVNQASIMKELSGVVISCAILVLMSLPVSAREASAGHTDPAVHFAGYPFANRRGPDMEW